MQAVPDKADHRDADEHDRRHRKSDDDVAGDGKAVRDQAQQIGKQDEHEEAKDERKIRHPLGADIAFDHVGDEFVAHFREGLQSARNECCPPRPEHGQRGDQDHHDRHQQRRVRIGEVEPADMQRQNALDCELLERMKFYRQISNPRRRPTCASLARRRQRPHLRRRSGDSRRHRSFWSPRGRH